ncbi:MAG: DEAD/DEAH box helicase [Caldilineaceae bacterium]
MKFEEFSLDPRILAGVRAAGYTTPTPIQQQAIPVVLVGKDILGLAQTGTGKTAAFALPILQHLLKGPTRKIRALIVAPTRELAEQIHQSFIDYGSNTKVRSLPIYGGVSKVNQVNELRRGVEVVVGCPGRLLDHIGDRTIDLSGIEVLVLDEADRMCDMGFLPDIRKLLAHLPKQRQTLFFSATMPDDIRQLSRDILTDPVTVQIGQIAPAHTVSHALYPVTDGLKNKLLFAMLEKTATGRVIIFTRTKRRARFLAADLETKRYRVAALQGNMAQNRRQEAINGFKDGKYDILVATDIAARGIDVDEISHVINFDMPDTTDAYTHRIGRTGRAEQNGEAFTFATPADIDMVRDIEKVLGKRIERRRFDGFDYNGFSPESFGTGASNGNSLPNQRQPQRLNTPKPTSKREAVAPVENRRNGNSNAAQKQNRPATAQSPVKQNSSPNGNGAERQRKPAGQPSANRGQNQAPSTRTIEREPARLFAQETPRRALVVPQEQPVVQPNRPAPRLVRPLAEQTSDENGSARRRIWRKRKAASEE